MGSTVYLHIGAMKTGTTFLQQLMQANKDNLLTAGLLIPGGQGQQVRGTRDILGTSHKRGYALEDIAGAWDGLVARMLKHDGPSVISMEFLSFANRQQAGRVVASLDGTEGHIILTVRDATKTLPAQWQTHCRNGGSVAWSTFAKAVRDGIPGGDLAPGGPGGGPFFHAQGIPDILEVWSEHVPAERLHVVTVPPSGSDPLLLWRRFAGVVGVDPEVATQAAPRSNPSLGLPSADLMRRINSRLGKLSRDQYAPTLKAELATNILSSRSSLERSPSLDLETRRFAVGWNQRVRAAIEASGVHVVGDLDELPVDLTSDAVERSSGVVEDPSDDEVLEAACTARDGLLDLVRTRLDRLGASASEIDLSAVDFEERPTKTQRWEAAADPLERALDELCELVRLAIDLRDRLQDQRSAGRTKKAGLLRRRKG